LPILLANLSNASADFSNGITSVTEADVSNLLTAHPLKYAAAAGGARKNLFYKVL
jgi:hypothetical protein